MTFDPTTLTALQQQGRQMRVALHETYPPDRRRAGRIQVEVDKILDNRPRVFAVASNGEAIYDNSSPWVKDQVSVVENRTDEPEPVLMPTLPASWDDMKVQAAEAEEAAVARAKKILGGGDAGPVPV